MSIISTDTDFIVFIFAYATYDPSLFVARCVLGYGKAISVQLPSWRLLRQICQDYYFFMCACCEET